MSQTDVRPCFDGVSTNGTILRRQRQQVTDVLARQGYTSPRVFGSTARGSDGPGSDIDLLVSAEQPPSLLKLGRTEQELSVLLGVPVEIAVDDALRPIMREGILSEAIPL